MAYAVPRWLENTKGLVKMVLMLRIPGDLSNRGVPVSFGTKCTTNKWQRLTDSGATAINRRHRQKPGTFGRRLGPT